MRRIEVSETRSVGPKDDGSEGTCEDPIPDTVDEEGPSENGV